MAEVTAGGEGGEGELEVVGGVGVGGGRSARIHERTETEDNEDAGKFGALSVARRHGAGKVVVPKNLLLRTTRGRVSATVFLRLKRGMGEGRRREHSIHLYRLELEREVGPIVLGKAFNLLRMREESAKPFELLAPRVGIAELDEGEAGDLRRW